MKNTVNFKPIAYIHNDFKSKFGIPRQSGIAKDIVSTIVFEPEYRDINALRGIEEYSHLWLIWYFSENKQSTDKWSATVRPPRLGGNKRMGVFATRSPYRPNPIGLSCVKLCNIVKTEKCGTVLVVSGADLLDNTPIFDIKPYLSFSDSIPDAKCGFANDVANNNCKVTFSDDILSYFDESFIKEITQMLSNNPKPSYQNNPDRVYFCNYAKFEIKFIYNEKGIYVLSITDKIV